MAKIEIPSCEKPLVGFENPMALFHLRAYFVIVDWSI